MVNGEHIGPYTILSKLGAGGMGEVYKARDSRLDRLVAVKLLPDEFARDPERRARFEREAKTLATLNHPHIAQIYGFAEALEAAHEAGIVHRDLTRRRRGRRRVSTLPRLRRRTHSRSRCRPTAVKWPSSPLTRTSLGCGSGASIARKPACCQTPTRRLPVRDGKTLYYATFDGRIMSVPVGIRGASVEYGAIRAVDGRPAAITLVLDRKGPK